MLLLHSQNQDSSFETRLVLSPKLNGNCIQSLLRRHLSYFCMSFFAGSHLQDFVVIENFYFTWSLLWTLIINQCLYFLNLSRKRPLFFIYLLYLPYVVCTYWLSSRFSLILTKLTLQVIACVQLYWFVYRKVNYRQQKYVCIMYNAASCAKHVTRSILIIIFSIQ